MKMNFISNIYSKIVPKMGSSVSASHETQRRRVPDSYLSSQNQNDGVEEFYDADDGFVVYNNTLPAKKCKVIIFNNGLILTASIEDLLQISFKPYKGKNGLGPTENYSLTNASASNLILDFFLGTQSKSVSMNQAYRDLFNQSCPLHELILMPDFFPIDFIVIVW